MNLTEARGALELMTTMVEGLAAKVMDVTHQAKTDESGFEFIGYAARRNILLKGPATTDEEEITKLLDSLYAALAERVNPDKPVILFWRLKPELICSSSGFRIGCRIKTLPTLAMPRLVSVNNLAYVSQDTK